MFHRERYAVVGHTEPIALHRQVHERLGNDWIVGGTGRDHTYGGYGNDLLNIDDDHASNPNNDIPDGPQYSYEDIAYGGAGRDVMIANTGGDRMADWAGEFNSYIVPFAPFGLPTVIKSVQPQLPDYLYDLSESDGADQTRASDTGADANRNGEPEGELGLVKQQDADWQAQTGAPDDPQPGNIPGGERDVLGGADFNNGQPQGFFIDSGVWTVESGRMEVSPESLGQDAVSVYNVGDLLPTYFEIEATINAAKPTGGSKSNTYIIYDYQSETDFKYAGINISTDKIQIGHRTPTGWVVDVQKSSKLKPNRDYDVLLSINGLTATLVVNNKEIFSHAFAPRIIDGFSFALNNGMVGLGANNATARLDNVRVQVLPPEITLDHTEEFDDGAATLFTGPSTGNWAVTGNDNNATYDGTPAPGTDLAASTTGLSIDGSSILQVETTFTTTTMGGIIFDQYGPNRFKYVGLSAQTGEVVIGHHTVKNGWVIDASIDHDITPNTEYVLDVSMKGTTVSVAVDGQAIVGHSFNAVTVDGDFGLFTHDGPSSFDSVTIKTNDPAYLTESSENNGGNVFTEESLTATVAPETTLLAESSPTRAARIDRRTPLIEERRALLAATSRLLTRQALTSEGLTRGARVTRLDQIQAAFLARPSTVYVSDPVKRVGSLLNNSDSLDRLSDLLSSQDWSLTELESV